MESSRLENILPVVKKEEKIKHKYSLNNKEIIYFSLFGLLMGFLYLICFADKSISLFNYSKNNYNFSATLYVFVTSILLTLFLKITNNLLNKKALIWLLPINLIGSCYTFFYSIDFRILNFFMIFILFSFFILKAVSTEEIRLPYLILKAIGNYSIFTVIFTKKEDENEKFEIFIRILKGVFLVTPFLIVIFLILISSDTIFYYYSTSYINNFLEKFNIIYLIIFCLTYIYSVGSIPYSKHLAYLSSKTKEKIYKLDTIIATVFLLMINLLFFIFCYSQLKFTLNNGFLMLPDNVIHSEYAREGFFGLLIVTLINFSIMYFFIKKLSAYKNKIVSIQLFTLCFFTIVLMWSSLYRMYLYIDKYGFTMLRLAVVTFLVMEFFLLLLTIYTLVKKDSKNYIKFFISILITFYVVANFTSSDYFTTKLNIYLLKSNKINSIFVIDNSLEVVGQVENLLNDKNYIYKDEYLRKRKDIESNVESDLLFKDKEEILKNISWKSWSYPY